MADHSQGNMDITEQEKTFAGFVTIVKWGVILCIAVLVFLALVNS